MRPTFTWILRMLPALLPTASAVAATFTDAPLLADQGVQALDRTVSRSELDRELFGEPYATVVVGHVDVYDVFPYLEARWFEVVADPAWNRLLAGELGGRVFAFDGDAASFGSLDTPHGLSTDEYGRVWVADTGNHRILALATRTEFGRIDLEPLFAINGLSRPYDVAFSDGGTPFAPGDDRVYVADTGRNRVVAFDVLESGAREAFAIGDLGRGVGHFAGPLAITVGRSEGAASGAVYVTDAHNGRIVQLRDRADHFEWVAQTPHAAVVTSLDTDEWGSLYATSPSEGTVTKYAADLTPLATLAGADHPRAFHVPFVNRTDHRTGEVRRVGQGSGLVVEEWTDTSGIRLVKLGVDVKDLRVQAGNAVTADFTTTDRAAVRADFSDESGRVIRSIDLGTREAGAQHVSFEAADLSGVPSGTTTLRVSAASAYGGNDVARAETEFPWTGSDVPGSTSGQLIGNEPNPFRSRTAIRFYVPRENAAVQLRVFDIAGRLVRVLDEGTSPEGVQVRSWDGTDQTGRGVRAGIYFVQLGVDGAVATKKVVLLR